MEATGRLCPRSVRTTGTRFRPVLACWGACAGLAVVAVGCGGPRTRYPHSLQSDWPQERVRAIKYAAEIGDESVTDLLVDNLEHDDEAVRFYAIQALERLTGTNLGYDYYASESDRRWAVKRWRRYLERKEACGPAEDTASP